MIKAEVTANGIINRSATNQSGKDGKPFTSFSIIVNIGNVTKEIFPLDIVVIKDGYNPTDALQYQNGIRVEIQGTLTFKKRGDKMYVNLSAKEINLNPTSSKDSIEGVLEFRGTIGKKIDEKKTKDNNAFQIFSGYSAEKVYDNFEYIWVRFLRFSSEPNSALYPASKVEIKAKLGFSVYHARLNIDCVINDIQQYVKPPFQPTQANNRNTPNNSNNEQPL